MSNEEEKTQEVQEETQERKSEETASVVERAEQAVERMKEENDRAEELVERAENAKANSLLGGRTKAGQEPEKPKEETEKEYSDKILSNNL